MTRWKIKIEYDGTDFCGWQRQSHDFSVQEAIEDAIEKFSGEKAALFVAGRTDAGVHALGQVAHFDLAKKATPDIIRDALNFHIRPHPITILEAEAVPDNFHARFDAKSRSYRYVVINRRAPISLMANRAWHVGRPLDIEPMKQAAGLLIGHHDFSTFRAANCQSKSPLKTLDFLEVTAYGECITFSARARSFLYHQVRNMVGSLVMVGTGQWSVETFAAAFEAHDRTKGGPTAPPQGLYLVDVVY